MDETQRPVAPDPGSSLSRREFAVAVSLAGAAAVATTAKAAMATTSSIVVIKTADGEAEAFFVHPATGTYPAVLIHTDAFGLRPAFQEMATRLAAEGYAVLVPNPFYRSAKQPAIAPGTTMATPGFREKFAEFRKPLTSAAVGSDTGAYVAWLDNQAAVKKSAKFGVQGYCMGGPMTFQSAAAQPARFGGACTFHGGGLVDEKSAESPHMLIPKTGAGAQFLCAVASNDDMTQPAAKDVLKTAFADSKRIAEVKVYDGCMHGWCVTDGAVYNKAGAEDAWGKMLAIYKGKLV